MIDQNQIFFKIDLSKYNIFKGYIFYYSIYNFVYFIDSFE